VSHFPFSRQIFARRRQRSGILLVLFLALVTTLASLRVRAEDAICHGQFPNYITDVCYSGMFPISLFGQEVISMGQDNCSPLTGATGFCTCLGKGGNTVFGIPHSFTEYSRMVDVTYTPYCFPLLGGARIDAGPGDTLFSPSPAMGATEGKPQIPYWFGNVNFYVNPLMGLLGAILDSDCTDKSPFDLAWISPLDPTWIDTKLNLLTTPYAFAFANPIAGAASAYDCVSATVGCPVSSMIWASGCNGHALPFVGHVGARVSGDQTGRLLTHRIIAHMHAMGAMWGRWGEEGLCGYYPLPIMDKGAYKTQRLLPIPQTKKGNGKCADPIGRTTVGSGGFEVPVSGKDFSYLVGVKRDCCSGVGVR